LNDLSDKDPLADKASKAGSNHSADVEASVKDWFNAPTVSISKTASQASAPLSDSLSATVGGLLQTTKENRWSIIV
jgi:hypothetical protein